MDTMLSPDDGFLDSGDPNEEGEDFVNVDIVQLHRIWRNEKFAPELLHFGERVVENISELCEVVGEDLDQERAEEQQDPNDPSWVLRCVDLERTKYVLRDYLRIRLWKITQYPQHYLDPDNIKLLSDAERIFLRDYWGAKKEFFHNRLLGALPPSKQGLDDKIDLMDMIRRPVLDKYIYVRIQDDLGTLQVPNQEITQDSQGSRSEELARGRTYLLNYQTVRPFLIEEEHAGEDRLWPKVDLV